MSGARFEKVPQQLDFPREEAEVLRFWREARIFERSLEQTKGKTPFVFYEGPPTANGLPHNGHVLTRVIKDLFPRYRTMRGYHVARKAGWDTHGLPVEVEVEKELRIHGKAAIEAYGVEPFSRKCIESVFRYTKEWEHLTERIGFWADLEQAYVTFHKSYVESVWWALSRLFEKGLLYEGHKVVWWWAQGGTALSSAEVGLGYKDVDDPSAYVAFPLADAPDTALLVWTTTPWTLPSNMYAAVGPKIAYVEVRGDADKAKGAAAKAALAKTLVLAKALVPALEKKLGVPLAILRELTAQDLVGKRYLPPFPEVFAGAAGSDAAWQVVLGDFVSLDAGTGIVHVAPAFGEDDHAVHRKLFGGEAPIFSAVQPDGTFGPELPKYQGRWVKSADKDLLEELKERALLVHSETYKHPYPFCWRSDEDPLIQLARPAWYIRTTEKKDAAIANNRTVSWLPEHIQEGRFGDFLANNVDWALSRERYWGTPLNLWRCASDASHLVAPASVAAIEQLGGSFAHFDQARAADPTLSEHLAVHKPWIDEVTFPCTHAGCQGTMRRVPEVIDCWFDSGCMPFAQWGFPHAEGSRETFARSFPADFISEAIDQTRGWFYSLLMIATLVFDEATAEELGVGAEYPLPYKRCIVLGHVSDKEGKKESKSKGNYTPPDVILDAVKMDFAVLAEAEGVAPKAGTCFVAKEDLEGLDLQEGAKVLLRRGHASGAAASATRDEAAPSVELEVRIGKKMKRRVVVLTEADRKTLGVVPTTVANVAPVEVPRLPVAERISLEDPSTPAPGADAFRWFFYAQSPPWSPTRHALSNVRALQKETLIKLRNVYSFFVIYAGIDDFDPHATGAKAPPPPAQRPELDRWILGELGELVRRTTADLDGFDVYTATGRVTDFVDALSNWYVRRSRARFWAEGLGADKLAAFGTLHECLVTLSLVLAPFVPFASEGMYRNLVVGPAARAGRDVPESVHLASWPEPSAAQPRDESLSRRIRVVRELVSLGLQVRTQAKIKVRQPLRTAYVILADRTLEGSLRESLALMQEELNVLDVRFVPAAEVRTYVEYRVKPSFRALGQRNLGREAQSLKGKLGALGPEEASALVARFYAGETVTVEGVDLALADVEIAFDTKEGFSAAGGAAGVVVLDSRLDPELEELGLVREIVSRCQAARKKLDLAYTARIALTFAEGSEAARVALKHADALAGEVLATTVTTAPSAPSTGQRFDEAIDGADVTFWVDPTSAS